MKAPILDDRRKADIMQQFARLAAEYLPEWHYDGSPDDPAAALAELFGEMFSQTVDRFNAIPEKMYTEFLNLLGVKFPGVTPATGLVQFTVHPGVTGLVPVPERTLLYKPDKAGRSIVFETERPIEATPAQLKAVYYADPVAGVVQQLDRSVPQPFFAPTDAPNLQRHLLMLSHNEVLSGAGVCTIELELVPEATYQAASLAGQMADPAFAAWSWRGPEGLMPFAEVRAENGLLLLRKDDPQAMLPEENGRICLTCEMSAGGGSICLRSARVRSIPTQDVPVQEMVQNELPLPPDEGGYCFGRMPAPYDAFCLRQDEVFSKRGAVVRLHFDMEMVVYSPINSAPQYEFNRSIIDKNSAVALKTDDVFVRSVVWEYYNGTVWSRLEVEGDRNPFSGRKEGPLELTFRVPEDLKPVLLDTGRGCYIRARVLRVENEFTSMPRWILPYVHGVRCSWSYESGRGVEWFRAENNARSVVLEDAASISALALEAYRDMEPGPRAMYLRFDRSPHGMPVSLMFDIEGRMPPKGKLLFEVWNGNAFEQIRVEDGTKNLENTGAVYLYIPRPLPTAEMFGRQGCWLRISVSRLRGGDAAPVVAALRLNTVTAVQQEHSPEQRFSTRIYDADKRVRVQNTPVLSCEVWVDEASSILTTELEELMERHPDDIRVRRENGAVTSCLVRWHQADDLSGCGGEERVYTLEPYTGEIRFGNGTTGRVPPAGFENIHVTSTFGGGTRGNLPVGELTEFLVSVPRISGLKNITPMSGGTDRMREERLEQLGNRRIRHCGRAVAARDFEELVAENFSRARHVRCFAGLDENGAERAGHVCVVVTADNRGNEQMGWELCREIESFLARRSSAALVASGRLHVRPSNAMTINISVEVSLTELDRVVRTQQEITAALEGLINERWQQRSIGEQIRLDEIYSAVKAVPNVASIGQMLVEGVFYENGRQYVRPIEAESSFLFATVESGLHTVRIR